MTDKACFINFSATLAKQAYHSPSGEYHSPWVNITFCIAKHITKPLGFISRPLGIFVEIATPCFARLVMTGSWQAVVARTIDLRFFDRLRMTLGKKLRFFDKFRITKTGDQWSSPTRVARFV